MGSSRARPGLEPCLHHLVTQRLILPLSNCNMGDNNTHSAGWLWASNGKLSRELIKINFLHPIVFFPSIGYFSWFFIHMILFRQWSFLNIISLPPTPLPIFHEANRQTSSTDSLIRKQRLMAVDTVAGGIKYTLKPSNLWLWGYSYKHGCTQICRHAHWEIYPCIQTRHHG